MFLRERLDYKAARGPCQADSGVAFKAGPPVPARGASASSFFSCQGPEAAVSAGASGPPPPAPGPPRYAPKRGDSLLFRPSAGAPGPAGRPSRPGPGGSSSRGGSPSRAGGLAASPGSDGQSSGGPAVFSSPLDEISRGPSLGPASSGPGPGLGASSAPLAASSPIFYLDCIAEVPNRGKSGSLAAGWWADHRKRTARAEAARRGEYRALGLDEDEAEIDWRLKMADRRNRENVCGSRVIPGACEEGHGHGKSCICNRPWCSICRERAHARRKAEWYKRAFKLDSMMVSVLTLPPANRPKTAAGLSCFKWVTTEVFKRRGFARGSMFLHPFGEPPADGSAPAYHPHLNIMTEGGWLSEESLEGLKKELGEELGLGKPAELHCHYYKSVVAKCHQVKYITRSTFLDRSWDYGLAEELYDFRYSSTWGVWDDPGCYYYPDKPLTKKAEERLFGRWARAEERRVSLREVGWFDDKWDLPEKDAEELTYENKVWSGVCPVCNKKMKWSRPVRQVDLGDPLRCPGRWEEIYPGIWQRNGPPGLARNFACLHPRPRASGRASPGGCGVAP